MSYRPHGSHGLSILENLFWTITAFVTFSKLKGGWKKEGGGQMAEGNVNGWKCKKPLR